MSVAKTDSNHRFRFDTVTYDFSRRTHIMGILNVTPDSFSDGGEFIETGKAIERAVALVEEGADIIDVGGESTRPGSDPVPLDEELRRVLPVVEAIVDETSVPVSIDTYKAAVAEEALKAGAAIVNDISGLTFDPKMPETIARHRASVVIMHIKGTPKNMQQSPSYDNVVAEVSEFLTRQRNVALKAGIIQVFVDPGLGFGKTLEHNLELLRDLETFKQLGCPVLVGPSRKSFLGAILDLPVGERLEGTAAACALSIYHGASVLRVHDVREMKRVALVADALARTRL